MVFAAGFGTRLAPMTERRPKPLVPVANRPMIDFGVDCLRSFGIDSLVVNAHHLPKQMEQWADACDVHVDLLVEQGTILGTGGGLKNARSYLSGESEFLVFNGDMLYEPDLAAAVEVHRASGAIATMVVRNAPDVARYGTISVDDGGNVSAIIGVPSERPTAGTRAQSYMFTGVHVLSSEVFPDLPERGCIIRETYVPWMRSGAKVMAVVDDSPFYDVGTRSLYGAANTGLCDGSIVRDGIHPERANLIHRGASVHGSVRQCVVGDGARVKKGVHLERCVVWDGADVAESAADVAFLDDGTRVDLLE